MYDSGISANDFINQLADEIDIAVPVPRSVYIDCINTAEQLLYSEMIREQAEQIIVPKTELESLIDLSALPVAADEDNMQ